MIKKKKYSLTLLEVIVSISLFAILLSFVFKMLFCSSHLYAKIESLEKRAFSKFTAYQTLFSLFFSLESSHEEKILFFTSNKGEDPSLIFSLPSTLDKDQRFSKKPIFRLYLENQTLILEESSGELIRKKNLLSNIVRMNFLFYTKNNKEEKKENPVSFWDENEKGLPIALKLFLTTQDTKTISFVFYLEPSSEPILFESP